MIRGKRNRIVILSIMILLLGVMAVLCGCEKSAEKIDTSEALKILSGVELGDASFSAEIVLENEEINKINATFLKESENEMFYIKKEKGVGDFIERTIYKVDGEFYLFENFNNALYKLCNYEYESMRAEFISTIYNKDEILLNDAYVQMQIYDFYGFIESVSLAGGVKKGDSVTINLSCPTIKEDKLFYIESRLQLECGKLVDLERYENVEEVYVSSEARAGLKAKTKSKVVKIDYENAKEDKINLPNVKLTKRENDVSIVYDISPFKINGKKEVEVANTFNESGVLLSDASEVIKLLDNNFNFSTFGYEFLGWFIDSDCKILVGNGGDLILYPQIEKIKLYGKFAKKKNILIAGINYGTANCLVNGADEISFGSGSKLSDVAKLVNEKNFYKNGFHFEGIYGDKDLKNLVIEGGVNDIVINDNVTLYLKFSKNVQIKVDESNVSNQLFRKYYISKSLLYSEDVKPSGNEAGKFVDYYLEKDFKTSLSTLTEEQVLQKRAFTVYPKFES